MQCSLFNVAFEQTCTFHGSTNFSMESMRSFHDEDLGGAALLINTAPLGLEQLN